MRASTYPYREAGILVLFPLNSAHVEHSASPNCSRSRFLQGRFLLPCNPNQDSHTCQILSNFFPNYITVADILHGCHFLPSSPNTLHFQVIYLTTQRTNTGRLPVSTFRSPVARRRLPLDGLWSGLHNTRARSQGMAVLFLFFWCWRGTSEIFA